MNAGMTLDTLGKMIVEQNAQKRDIVAPTTLLRYDTHFEDERLVPAFTIGSNGDRFGANLTDHAHRQLVQWAGIPSQYVDKLRTSEHRALLAENVNHWLQWAGDKRMIRLLDGPDISVARAFLSPKYRPLDNYDLMERVLPKVRQPGYEIKSCSLTETRLYLQVVTERLTRDIGRGDIVQAGVVISNSEVGAGRIKVEPMLYRLVCTNGLISGVALRKNHVGRGFEDNGDDDVTEYFSDETRKLDDEAFWAKLSDVIDGSFDEAKFSMLVSKFKATQEMTLNATPDKIVDVTAKRLDLNQSERDSVLMHLFQGGDLTMFGLVNAVTRSAEDAPSYDRAVELERLGGQMLEWRASDVVPPSEN